MTESQCKIKMMSDTNKFISNEANMNLTAKRIINNSLNELQMDLNEDMMDHEEVLDSDKPSSNEESDSDSGTGSDGDESAGKTNDD